MTGLKKKHPQFILAIANQFFATVAIDEEEGIAGFKTSGISQYNNDDFMARVQSYLFIGERHHLEQNTDYRQILPYLMVRQLREDGQYNYFTYRREDTAGEAKLAGNVSIGYGGHIDLVDIVSDDKSVIDLRETIVQSLLRELDEELDINMSQAAQDRLQAGDQLYDVDFTDLFIYDHSNDVNDRHLAVIVMVTFHHDVTLTTKEPELTSMPPMTDLELLSSGLPMETWTRFYLEHIVYQRAQALALQYEYATDQTARDRIDQDLLVLYKGAGRWWDDLPVPSGATYAVADPASASYGDLAKGVAEGSGSGTKLKNGAVVTETKMEPLTFAEKSLRLRKFWKDKGAALLKPNYIWYRSPVGYVPLEVTPETYQNHLIFFFGRSIYTELTAAGPEASAYAASPTLARILIDLKAVKDDNVFQVIATKRADQDEDMAILVSDVFSNAFQMFPHHWRLPYKEAEEILEFHSFGKEGKGSAAAYITNDDKE